MDYLKELLLKCENGEKVEVVCSSDVFREFYFDYSSVTVWILDNVLYISSTKEYNMTLYYSSNKILEIYSTSDKETILKLYNASALNYVYPANVLIQNVIDVIEGQAQLTK